MTPEELAAIRERAEDAKRNREMFGKDSRSRRIVNEASALDVLALLTEVERLTGEEQRLHGRLRDSERTISELFARNSNVQALLDKVRALHSPVAPSPSRPWVTCSGCTNGGTYPCPTIQAIDGETRT